MNNSSLKNNLKIMGVIPARFNSSRLPGKALREIAGKPMIHWVYLNAKRSPLLTDLAVATDSPENPSFLRGGRYSGHPHHRASVGDGPGA